MAPSVKVKQGDYSQLRDPTAATTTTTRPRRPSVLDIFSSGSSPPATSDRLSPPATTPGQHATSDNSNTLAPRTRDRGKSVSHSLHSKISHHVLNESPMRSRRHRPRDASGESQSSLAPSHGTISQHSRQQLSEDEPEHMMTIQGSQADVVLQAESEYPGRISSALSLTSADVQTIHSADGDDDEFHHHDDIVEHLDAIDPQVATVSDLTNAANSLLIPPLSFYSRKPVVVLSPPSVASGTDVESQNGVDSSLDRHVDDVLKHPSKYRRMLAGVWSFLKTPLGIIFAIYGFCVVFWGAAIVFFLLKIINLHNADRQGFWVEISSQVVNGLFTLPGVGLFPPRLIDTYRVVKIYHYKLRTRRLRKEANLPALYDEDDLPDPAYDPNYVHVLSDAEERDLHHHQVMLQKSQTWYRPHGSETHRAFPIKIALIVCLLNDLNSIFQCMLASCMWSMNRFIRPAWTTGSLIPAGFISGIGAGVTISIGGKKTRRTKEVQERLRAVLATDLNQSDLAAECEVISSPHNEKEGGGAAFDSPEIKVEDSNGNVEEKASANGNVRGNGENGPSS